MRPLVSLFNRVQVFFAGLSMKTLLSEAHIVLIKFYKYSNVIAVDAFSPYVLNRLN